MGSLPKNKYLSIQEAAKHLGVSTKTLRRWEASNKLVPVRTKGGHRRYVLSDLINTVNKKQVKPRKVYVRRVNELTSQPIVNSPILNVPNSVIEESYSIDMPKEEEKITLYKSEILAPQQIKVLKTVGYLFFSFLFLAFVYKTSPLLINGKKEISNTKNKIVSSLPFPFLGKSLLASYSSDFPQGNDLATARAQNVQVLAAQTSNDVPIFNINIESSFKEVADFVKGLTSTDVSTGTIETTGAATFGNNVSITGDIISPSATFNLLNSGVTTLNIGGASTATSISATTGTTTINNDLKVKGVLTLSGGLNVPGKITGGGDLSISGSSALSGSLSAGATTLSSLNVSGASALTTITGSTLNLTGLFTGTGITSSGAITFSSLNAEGLIYSDTNGTLSAVGPATAGLCLSALTANTYTWASCAATWQKVNATDISPLVAGDNLIIGGTTTSNGKFQVSGTTGSVSSSGNISTTGSGTITSAGLLTASSGLNVTGTVNLAGLSASSAVYTDSSRNLTSTPPASGTLGYWSRSGSVLSPATTTDSINITPNTTTGTGASAGLYLAANSLTTGNGVDISSTSTAGDGSKLINLSRSGANGTSAKTNYGLYSSITNTGTTSTNVAGYFSASGATNNYGIVIPNGYLGLGTATPASQLDINATATNGTVLNLAYGASTTLTGDLVAAKLNVDDGNVIATNQNITGLNIKLPTVSNDGAGNYSLKGFYVDFGTGSGINNMGAGSTTYNAAQFVLPALTQTSGTLTANGLAITNPSGITTGGTANGISISSTGVGAGTLNGLNIGTISGGAGSETAINIGSGWDNVLKVNGNTVVNGSGVVPETAGGTNQTTYTKGDILYSSAANTLSKLAVGSTGYVLTVSAGGVPTWNVISGSSCSNCLINNPSSDQVISPIADANGLEVKQSNAVSPTADIFSVTSNNGLSKYFYVDSSGVVHAPNLGSFGSDQLTIEPGTDKFALKLKGTNVATNSLELIESHNTQGNIFGISYPSSTSLNGTVYGFNTDLSTNLTATNQSVFGANFTLPAVTNTNTTGTKNITGIAIAAGGGLNQNGAGGTTQFAGVDITLPALTQSAGTINGYGVNLTTPSSITTGGTAAAVNVNASGVGAGTLYGLNISGITAGSGTETALNIGAGWDNGISSASLISATGGLTLTGATNINTTGTSSTAIGNSTGTFALTSNGGLNVTTGGILTGVASIDTITTSSTALSFAGAGTLTAASTGLNLESDGTVDVNIAGGSSATGCTIANSTGNLTCSGSITGASTGTLGYWSRSGTTLSPATTNDIVSVSSNTASSAILALTASGATTSAATLSLTNTSGSQTNGLLIDRNGASGTTTNGLNITNTNGTLTNGINISSGTIGTGLNISSTGVTTDIALQNGESIDNDTNGIINLAVDATSALKVGSTGISSIGNIAHTIVNNAGALNIDSNSTGALNIGTGANAKTITIGNNTGATALNFTSGTGSQTFTSSATSNNAFAFVDNSLTSAKLGSFSSTSTGLTGTAGVGSLLNLDWSPGSATTATGDLFAINIGANGLTTGNLLNVLNNGSSLFSVSQTTVTSNLPTSFTAPGDVSIAYDLQFTNQTSSTINSKAPLYLVAGESFESNDLTLKTYNFGSIEVDSGNTTGNIFDITNSTLTTGNAINLSASTLTTGTLLNAATSGNTWTGNGTTTGLINIASTSTAATGSASNILLNLSRSGANTNSSAISYGLYSSVTNTGTTSTDVGGFFTTSGATSQYALQTGNLTAASSGTLYGINVGTLTGASSATFAGVNIGAISGAGTLSEGLAIGANTATATTNEGIDIGAISGAGTTNTAINIGALSGATTTKGIVIGNLSGATSTGLTLGALSGTTADTGISIGNISAGTGTNNGISLGTLTGGTGSSGNQISTGAITSIASGTWYGLNLGAVAGASSATFGAINTGALTGAGTQSAGINLGANSSTATSNYGVNIAAISGAGTTNAALNIAAVSGATNNYGLLFANAPAQGSIAAASNVNLGFTTTGTGSQVFTSAATTGTTTSGAFVFTANSVNSGTGTYLSSTSLTTGKLFQISTGAANTLTTGTLADIRSTATSLTGTAGTGSFLNLDWSPGSATVATGDLFAINIGANGTTTGNLFNILNAGSSIFSVGQAQITNGLPTQFTAPGDIAAAYDLQFTNPVSSIIKSAAPLTIAAGEVFNSSNLTLRSYNLGNILLDTGTSSTGTGKVGVGPSVTPLGLFHVSNQNQTTTIGKALAIFDQYENQDILTASQSGVTKLTVKNLSTNFGAIADTGAFVDNTSSMAQEFNSDIQTGASTADSAAVGDDSHWYVDLSTAASTESWLQGNNTNGFVRMALGATSGRGTLLGFGEAQNTLNAMYLKANLPVVQMKIRTSLNANTDDIIWGLTDQATAITTNDPAPTNGIYFSSNNGSSWVGIVRSGGSNVGTVTCPGSISTSQFATGRINVISATSVDFWIDNDASDGVNMLYCGNVSGANPTAALAPVINATHTDTNAWNVDVDYIRTWQDDSATIADIPQHNNSSISNQTTLDTRVTQLENEFDLFKTALTASDSGIIENVYKIDTTKLNVLGDTTLGDTVITGKLNVGGLTIDSTSQSVNAIGTLKIQDLALGNVEFMNGLITFDTHGNIVAKSITADKYKVAGTSAGTGILPANQTSIVINTNAVTSTSLIFVTAQTTTVKTLAVTSKVNGTSFKVEVPSSDTKDIQFNWWIVDGQ